MTSKCRHLQILHSRYVSVKPEGTQWHIIPLIQLKLLPMGRMLFFIDLKVLCKAMSSSVFCSSCSSCSCHPPGGTCGRQTLRDQRAPPPGVHTFVQPLFRDLWLVSNRIWQWWWNITRDQLCYVTAEILLAGWLQQAATVRKPCGKELWGSL